jgi:acyl-coenzyme A synthetase/AMP-(fatty) acid ligase
MNDWFALIESHMRTQPERPALVMENRIATYGMLQNGIERCARRIASLKLAPEQPVAILYSDPIRHFVLCLALHRIGIPSLSLSPNHSGIKALKIGAVLSDADAMKANFPAARLVEATDEWFAIDTPDDGAVLPQGFTDKDQICRFSLTSGTTGEPKLITLTIENIGRRSQMYTSTDWKVLLNLPGMATTFGFIPSCAALAAGRTLCFAQSPYQAARMIELFSVDFVNAATEQLIALTRVARKSNAHFKTLRTVQVGGSMPTRTMLEAAMTHVCRDIQNRYAGTELGSMARAGAQEILQNPGLAGYIEPGVEIGIFDDEGTRRADGKSGHVKARYEGGEAWIDVGDIGWIAPEKKLFIVGRSVDGAGGGHISPVHEIEHLVRLEWDMADAGAVLAGDAGAKPQIWVATVENKDASAEKLEAIAQARGIDCAIRLFDLKSIPRNANGKINRAALKTVLLAADSSKKH